MRKVEFCVMIRDRDGSGVWKILEQNLWTREDAAQIARQEAAGRGPRAEFTVGVRDHIPFARLSDVPIYRREGGSREA